MDQEDILIGALDQGTSSCRFIIFSIKDGSVITFHQEEFALSIPHEGWEEIDPVLLVELSKLCMEKAVENLVALGRKVSDIKGIGITNMRETAVVWDKVSGKPLYNAIIWSDARTGTTVHELVSKVPRNNIDYLKNRCGLPLSTYFSAVKVKWMMDNVEEVAKAIQEDRCIFGTVDSWLVWNLTDKVHVTDVTNASRTMLMNISTLQWDNILCDFFKIPMSILPEIRSSSEIYGNIQEGALAGLPISGILGDQQAALVGQMCFKTGEAKNTYGTGCFLLYNTGVNLTIPTSGLLATVGYQMGPDATPVYALEGSIAHTGSCIRWLRDQLNIIETSSEIEDLANTVPDNGGVYFVPAFTGLLCPYWQHSARGTICGLTAYSTKAHIARAILEAVCFQTKEILDAMNQESGIPLTSLQVDGGMTVNNLLMQLQADVLGIPVIRSRMSETTAFGAAIAAAKALGFTVPDLSLIKTTDSFYPKIDEENRAYRFGSWKLAINRSLNWTSDQNKLLPITHPKREETGEKTIISLGTFIVISVFLNALSVMLN